MSDPAVRDAAPNLDALRVEIDRIDRAMHTLLMERGDIIDRLIAVKARQGGGSAFRPGREAQMMRDLVTRHAGILPLDTVESIWRIIISTFTYVQAPYSVHVDIAGGDAAMRDSCRFHFGFTVPLATHEGPAAVIAAVVSAPGDLGLVRADIRAADAPSSDPRAAAVWWHALEAPDAPKIIARLPFVERADHAAGLPLYVVAKPLAEAAVSDICLYALDGVAESHGLPAAAASVATSGVAASGGTLEVIAERAGPEGRRLLVAAAGTIGAEAVAAAFAGRHGARPRATWIGSHARRFEIDAVESVAAQ